MTSSTLLKKADFYLQKESIHSSLKRAKGSVYMVSASCCNGCDPAPLAVAGSLFDRWARHGEKACISANSDTAQGDTRLKGTHLGFL